MMNSFELMKFIKFCEENFLSMDFIINPENIREEKLIEWRDKKDIYWDVKEENSCSFLIRDINKKIWEQEHQYQFVCINGRVQQIRETFLECSQCLFGGDKREEGIFNNYGCQKRKRILCDDGEVRSISQIVYENIDWIVDMILKIRKQTYDQ